jgi:acetylornithine aminotransferase
LNDTDEISRLINQGDIAAIIIEGIQGISGVVTPEDGFLQFLEKTCNRHGTMLILDEIQSGFGRTGKFFAHQYANIKPHLITIAKGMGNGFPVGGVLIHPDIKSSMGMLGTTFGGGHLACAATTAVLEVIRKYGLIKNAHEMGLYFQDQLMDIPEIKEIRGRGLMIGISFDFPIKELRANLLKDGVLTGNSSNPNILRLLPPLCISKKEIDTVINKLKIVLNKISKSETVSISK